ncbi:unnamed protein product [Chondrus crispus]|uniref:Uncharacterized protein n=1 Tax=Chondrus crispus TaxID=2769 RepID=R7QIQ9_CHOCR|nr:unnamed protein product [Chondrus crispus]CDF37361.1 unnamed protein product [Chondrus crispus]|eukprot:XP_005717180.1 unnamed protein product [Chondrus crispus]
MGQGQKLNGSVRSTTTFFNSRSKNREEENHNCKQKNPLRHYHRHLLCSFRTLFCTASLSLLPTKRMSTSPHLTAISLSPFLSCASIFLFHAPTPSAAQSTA